MEINRRKLRASLGTRRNRREGTGGKVIPGSGGGTNQRRNKYRYPRTRTNRTQPRVLLERLVRATVAKAGV